MSVIEGEKAIKIGELLVRAGILTGIDLSEAEKLSKHMGLQFGRVLIMSGCLAERDLESALEAQAMIRDGMVEVDLACQALGISSREDVTLEEALEALNVVPKFGTATLELAELLADAAIISGEVLGETLQESLHTNASLGELLVQKKAMSPSLLPILNSMLELIRAGQLVQTEAVEEIRKTYYTWAKADRAMDHDRMSQSPVLSFQETPQWVTADQLHAAPHMVPQAPPSAQQSAPQPQQQSAQSQAATAHSAGQTPSIEDFMSSFSEFAAQQYRINPPAEPPAEAPIEQPQYELNLDHTPGGPPAEHSIFDVLSVFQEKISQPAYHEAAYSAYDEAVYNATAYNEATHSEAPPGAAANNERVYSEAANEPVYSEAANNEPSEAANDEVAYNAAALNAAAYQAAAYNVAAYNGSAHNEVPFNHAAYSAEPMLERELPARPSGSSHGVASGGDASTRSGDYKVETGSATNAYERMRMRRDSGQLPAPDSTHDRYNDAFAVHEQALEPEESTFDALIEHRFEQAALHGVFEQPSKLPVYDEVDAQQNFQEPSEYGHEPAVSDSQLEEAPVIGYEMSSAFSGANETRPATDADEPPSAEPEDGWTAQIESRAGAAEEPEEPEEALPDIFENEEPEQQTFEPTSTLIELLVESGHLQREQIYQAYLRALQDNEQSAKLLAVLEMTDKDTIDAASVCTTALIEDRVNPDEAIEVLYAIKCGAPIQEALAMAHLSLPEPPDVVAVEKEPAALHPSINLAYLDEQELLDQAMLDEEELLAQLETSESPEIDGALFVGAHQAALEIFDAGDFESEPEGVVAKPPASGPKHKAAAANPFDSMRGKKGRKDSATSTGSKVVPTAADLIAAASASAPPAEVSEARIGPKATDLFAGILPTPPDLSESAGILPILPEPLDLSSSKGILPTPGAFMSPAATAAADASDSQWDLDTYSADLYTYSADANPAHEREPIPEKFMPAKSMPAADVIAEKSAPSGAADAEDSEWILAEVPTLDQWGRTDSARSVLGTEASSAESQPRIDIVSGIYVPFAEPTTAQDKALDGPSIDIVSGIYVPFAEPTTAQDNAPDSPRIDDATHAEATPSKKHQQRLNSPRIDIVSGVYPPLAPQEPLSAPKPEPTKDDGKPDEPVVIESKAVPAATESEHFETASKRTRPGRQPIDVKSKQQAADIADKPADIVEPADIKPESTAVASKSGTAASRKKDRKGKTGKLSPTVSGGTPAAQTSLENKTPTQSKATIDAAKEKKKPLKNRKKKP